MKKKLLAILITACMLFALMPIAAGAAAEALVIKLAIGSPTLSVNGSTSTIQKPFKLNGTTMVPLSVITKAFGAGLKLENNKIITLSYNSTKVVLTIGSKIVKVNGAPVTLTAEPKIVNGVTMVPLRVIVSAFGAKLTLSGNQITINGVKANASGTSTGSNTGGINSDAGKTKIGDSYYGWTMNYPSDLVLSYQSDNGSATQWTSAQDDRRVAVFVEDVDQAYTREELRDHIMGYFAEGEFSVEKKTITIGDLSIERIVSKDRDGFFFDNRAIQVGTRIYFVAVGVKADSRDKLDPYQDLLNSFKPSFAANDGSLKDITKVKDGYMTAINKDYGLSVALPVDWQRDNEASTPTFNSENGYLNFEVSSLKAGDTAQAWLKRIEAKLQEEFQPEYLRNIDESTIVLADGIAQVLSFEYTLDKKSWKKVHDVLLVTGSHKYEINYYSWNEDASVGDALYRKIVGSVNIDTNYIEKNFSELEDSEELEKMTVQKTSKKYGYSIKLPQNWKSDQKDFEKEAVVYSIPYGIFEIDILTDFSASDYASSAQQFYSTDADMVKLGAQLRTNTTTTLANGLSAKKIVVDFTKSDAPQTGVYYVVEKDGITYVLSYVIMQASDTESSRSKLEEVINSFAFKN
ncbi:stalk domain-containing protein [Paenibacillus sp. BC26]|uniref:stalk domain-containing protein n=1 Tax=Paenibacillus sp. BC26 TaxID=1881032 RepID=UPI0008EFF85B|nr:stalk domain-containing protein [Paenibacillus sp. BC26]SFT25785.1 Copper amine oxidase N-terminal domain-containing protein [Paenibacillus sp. BC26]